MTAPRGIERGRTFARLLITYVAVTEALHVLWTGRFSGAPETIVKALVIPALETAFLEGARAIAGKRRGALVTDELARFFGRCLILAAALAAATPAIDFMLVRRVDLTTAMWLALLVTPAIQAAALVDLAGLAPLGRVVRTVWRHPLVTPVLFLDGAMLLAGGVFAGHALVGLPEAAVLQRRWLGSKLLVAAVVFSLRPARDNQAVVSQNAQRVPRGLAVMLAGIALSLFAPATLADVARLLSAVTFQPPAIVLLEIYTASMLIVVVLAVALRRAIAGRSRVAHCLIACATLALFAATLALLMNGFVSAMAMRPWAGLAVTSGSAAATLFLAAALILSDRSAEAS